MRHRWVWVGVVAAVAALPLVTGCADTGTGASASSVVTVTATQTTRASAPVTGTDATSTDVTGTDVSTTGDAPASPVGTRPPTTNPLPPGHGIGASAYLGAWQRHESSLTFNGDHTTGSVFLGANAVDGEKWGFTWTIDRAVITATLTGLIERSGAGVGGMATGQTFTATPTVDSAGTEILVTTGLGETGSELTWCRSGHGSPGCGA